MAEMLVDSTKLDACLDAEADAIRAKTGGSADIPFDFANNKGFADAIAAIPSGGGETWALHSVQITIASATQIYTILHQYIKRCAAWRIYPTDANNTATNTIATGPAFDDSLQGVNINGSVILLGGSTTSATGVSVGGSPSQYSVNDQTYNNTRSRTSVGTKPAGAYQLDFYGVAK